MNASSVCPESVRPFSVSVAEIINDTLTPSCSIARRAAYVAAFALSVSNIVSSRRMSTPPCINARIWSIYVATRESQLTSSSRVDAIERDLLVGPTLPATQH